ncbi:hypothetical protein KSP40_PGU017713 [Platanthera guangdongensis]|uniref:RRM domain-containing protein n=1 Tax=Platanthera guangdongensis TaxID=2320717 RepID=A0ABR2LLV4_9ASPA
MSAYNSSVTVTQENTMSSTVESIDSYNNVPVDMRDYYYFAILLSNLPHTTTADLLRSLFQDLPGFLHASVDITTSDNQTTTGELIFTDEVSMHDAAIVITGQIIDGIPIATEELRLFDIKPEYYQHTHINNNNSSNSDDNYYDELYPPTTTRWSDLPRTEIPGFRLRIPAVPAGLTPQEEWNYVFTMIRSPLTSLKVDAIRPPTPASTEATLDSILVFVVLNQNSSEQSRARSARSQLDLKRRVVVDQDALIRRPELLCSCKPPLPTPTIHLKHTEAQTSEPGVPGALGAPEARL